MSFDIRFDYSFDDSGFFDPPARRTALDTAAGVWESILQDEFEDVPAGVVLDVRDPENRSQNVDVTLAQPIDDLLVFVGATGLGGALGRAGPTGINAKGDVFNVRVEDDFRGTGPVTDFEPWAGSVTFDPSFDWNFDTAGPVPGKPDFISTAVHEIGHILGIGTAPIFEAIGAGAAFDGPNALTVNGGAAIPLESDLGHVVDGFDGDTVLMDPTNVIGTRKSPTDIDKALLADIGYEIAGFARQGSTPPIATEGDDGTIFGTVVGDRIDGLGGDDQVQGEEGDDTLSGGTGTDTIFGQEGTDLFEVRAGGGLDRIQDFDFGTERLRLIDSGFATPQDALAAVTKPFINVSRLSFADGTEVDVFQDSVPGTQLTTANIELQSTQPPDYALAALDANRDEGDPGASTRFTFEITRTGDTSQPLDVSYQVTPPAVNPADGADFVGGALPFGQVTIPGGQPTETIAIDVAGDALVEPDEIFTLRIDSDLGVRTAGGIILNDDTAPDPPEIAVAAPLSPLTEGDAGSTDSVFTVTRSGDTGPAITLDYAVTAGGANPAEPSDFAGGIFPSGQVTVPSGADTVPLPLPVAGDGVVETDETFTLILSNPSTGTVATATATSAIIDDDTATLSVRRLDADRAEGDAGTTPFTFEATLSAPVEAPVTATYAVPGQFGAGPDDFDGGALPTGSVDFPPGVTARVITVGVAGDTDAEPDETFALNLQSAFGNPGTLATIRDDDSGAQTPVVSVSGPGGSVDEGDSGTRSLPFTLTRTGDTGQPVSLDYAITGSGADPAEPADFAGGAFPAGRITIPAGTASAPLPIAITGDGVLEGDEGVTLTISGPSTGEIGTGSAQAIIRNDDAAAFSIAALDADRPEGDSGAVPFTFAVSLSAPAERAQSVDYAAEGDTGPGGTGDPAGGGDFFGGTFPTGTLSFAPGETARTLTIPVQGDPDAGPDEFFAVSLSNPLGGAGIATARAGGAIRDDDTGGNRPPVAALDTATTFTSTPVTVAVLDNDTDPDGDAVDLAGVVAPPAPAEAEIRGDALRITPPPGFTGTLDITYEISDGRGGTDEGLVTLSVIPPGAADGVIRGTDRDDPILVGQNATYLGFAGADTFVVSPAVAGGGVSVIEARSGDTIQAVAGLEIVEARLRPTALQLTLTNGAQIRVLEADRATFDAGGNVTLERSGAVTDYAGFATGVFGTPLPASGEILAGPAVIPDPAALGAAEAAGPERDTLTQDTGLVMGSLYPAAPEETSMDPEDPITLPNAPIQIVEEVALFFEIGLGRPPAPAGLTFWTQERLDFENPGGKPGRSSLDLAEAVFESDEFADNVGDPAALTDRELVESLFRNVLKREGAQAGIDFWTNEIDSGVRTRAEVLKAFAESAENRAKVPELSRLAFDPDADDGKGQWVFDPDPALGEAQTGTAGADFLRGLGGNDTLTGLDGDDEFLDGATALASTGDDVFDGGSGADTVIYEAARTGFGFAADAVDDDILIVTAPNGDVDRLDDVETIRFISDIPDAGTGAFVEEVAVADLLGDDGPGDDGPGDDGPGNGGGEPTVTAITAVGTFQTTDGPDIFTVNIDSSTDEIINPDYEGEARVPGFDPAEDVLRFVETGGGDATEADILAENGLFVIEDPFEPQLIYILGDNPAIDGDDGAQIVLPGIAEQSGDFIEVV